MNAEQTIATIRELAGFLAIRGGEPGHVSEGVRFRVLSFLATVGVPFEPWTDGREYTKKLGTAVVDGVETSAEVHRLAINDKALEVCNAIASCLLVANWRALSQSPIHPAFHNWTPERAELAIVEASQKIPRLCDELEQVTSLSLEPEERQAGEFDDLELLESDLEFLVAAIDLGAVNGVFIKSNVIYKRATCDTECPRELRKRLKGFGLIKTAGSKGSSVTDKGLRYVRTTTTQDPH